MSHKTEAHKIAKLNNARIEVGNYDPTFHAVPIYAYPAENHQWNYNKKEYLIAWMERGNKKSEQYAYKALRMEMSIGSSPENCTVTVKAP